MKKVLKNFRIRVDLVESLKAKSKAVGIPETQFVEELLDEYLEKKFNEHAKARSAAIGKIQKPRKGNP